MRIKLKQLKVRLEGLRMLHADCEDEIRDTFEATDRTIDKLIMLGKTDNSVFIENALTRLETQCEQQARRYERLKAEMQALNGGGQCLRI